MFNRCFTIKIHTPPPNIEESQTRYSIISLSFLVTRVGVKGRKKADNAFVKYFFGGEVGGR